MRSWNVVMKAALGGAALVLLQACSPAVSSTPYATVAEAYDSSGVVAIKPYTRSIFNTNNF